MADGPFHPGRLRLARELRGWSQAKLAREVDVTPAAVSQFESGASRPSRETLEELADQLAVPVEFLSLPLIETCLLYTSPSPRDRTRSRMPSSA